METTLRLPNIALEQTAGSRSLAAAAHRERSAAITQGANPGRRRS